MTGGPLTPESEADLFDLRCERCASCSRCSYNVSREFKDARAEIDRLRSENAADAQRWFAASHRLEQAIKRLRCPACGSTGTLFVGEGNYLTCSWLSCPEPDFADAILREAVGEGK